MARTQTMVQLNSDLVTRLDEEAVRRNVSRSSLIREAIAEYLDRVDESVAVAQYVAGYERIPPSEPDAWGSLEAQNDQAGHLMAQRLDAEADRAGVEW